MFRNILWPTLNLCVLMGNWKVSDFFVRVLMLSLHRVFSIFSDAWTDDDDYVMSKIRRLRLVVCLWKLWADSLWMRLLVCEWWMLTITSLYFISSLAHPIPAHNLSTFDFRSLLYCQVVYYKSNIAIHLFCWRCSTLKSNTNIEIFLGILL